MSSQVPRSQRKKRDPRLTLSDLNSKEQGIIKALAKTFGGPIVVFGSRARGNWAEDSDIDVGIPNYSYRNHRNLIDNMSKTFGIKIDAHRTKAALTHSGAFVAWE